MAIELPSTFCTAGRSSFNFRQLSMWPLTSVNFPLGYENFLHCPSIFRATTRPSVCYPCNRRTCNHFHQQFVRTGDFTSTSVNFPCGGRPSVNCCHFPVKLRELLSTFINFSCRRETCHQSLSNLCAEVNGASLGRTES